MNLRVLVNPKEAEGHPLELFFVGLVYAALSVFLSLWLFPAHASIILIGMTVAASAPIVYHIISLEAKKDTFLRGERSLLIEHKKAILVFTFLFLGFVAGFTISFLFLPEASSAKAFSAQTDTIAALTTPTGGFAMNEFISAVLINNFRVLFFTTVLSILFGTGGILILAWNASVMSVAIGNVISQKLAVGSTHAVAVASSVSKYFTHGVPEIIAYLIGGVAGGILFHAIIRKVWSRQLFLDVFILLSLASALLVLAAAIEAYVTPFVA